MLILTPISVNHHDYLTQVTEKMLNQRDLLLKHKPFKFSVILEYVQGKRKKFKGILIYLLSITPLTTQIKSAYSSI